MFIMAGDQCIASRRWYASRLCRLDHPVNLRATISSREFAQVRTRSQNGPYAEGILTCAGHRLECIYIVINTTVNGCILIICSKWARSLEMR
jgi:hypothetical protein